MVIKSIFSILMMTLIGFSLCACFETDRPREYKQQPENLNYKSKHGYEPGTKDEFMIKRKPDFDSGSGSQYSPDSKSGFKSND